MRIQIQPKSLPVILILAAAIMLFTGIVNAQDSSSPNPLSVEGVVAARNAITGGGGVVHDQGNSIAVKPSSTPSAAPAPQGNYFSGGKFETFERGVEGAKADSIDSYRYQAWQNNWD